MFALTSQQASCPRRSMPHYRSPTAASFLVRHHRGADRDARLGVAGVAPYLGIASGAIGLGTVGIIAMRLGLRLRGRWFWNSERANRLTTRILRRCAGQVAHALLLIGIIANYSALTRSDNQWFNSLPLVLIPVVIGALLCALDEGRAAPAKYAVLSARASAVRRASRTGGVRAPLSSGGRRAGFVVARAGAESCPSNVYERQCDVAAYALSIAPGAANPSKRQPFISSKWCSYFYGFPFPDNYPSYPSNRQILDYTRAFARTFDLYRHITQYGSEARDMRQ